jgi:hypothetical protein
LIDVDWATDPSLLEDADIPFFHQHIGMRVLAGEYGRGLGVEAFYVFLDGQGVERRLELPHGANVSMYAWQYGELPMPPAGRVLRMGWTFSKTD